MSYDPPRRIKKEDMDKAERNFSYFFASSALILIIVIIGMCTNLPSAALWQGNRLWTLGSLLVFLTVVHGRFFDVQKKSNTNYGFQPDRSFTTWIKLVEGWIHHAWVLGSVLLFVARFVPY